MGDAPVDGARNGCGRAGGGASIRWARRVDRAVAITITGSERAQGRALARSRPNLVDAVEVMLGAGELKISRRLRGAK